MTSKVSEGIIETIFTVDNSTEKKVPELISLLKRECAFKIAHFIVENGLLRFGVDKSSWYATKYRATVAVMPVDEYLELKCKADKYDSLCD